MKKILIANRGEIACRIMKTAKRLGWQTVAVYSSADVNAMHVALADEAFLIGDPPPSESYLDHKKILDVAVAAGVDAIHPGYGFLSENADFAKSCAANKINFVGPPAEAVNIMGLKGIARQKMEDVGVPVLPGINKITDTTTAEEIASIGYPVLIKPEAGGGGKGMKIVHNPAELEFALSSARREALSAFGNDSLMLEKFLVAPRHIEIQVFADSQGNCIHLNERDCSLQRRHQKIIEESPAPHFSDELRQTMGAAAVAAAKAINYIGAGTVEFLLSSKNEFYFMEMNTRLQVEHPVTEMITGLDLVEWQLIVAMGGELPLTQEEITINGHATEVRLYAEDPANEFLPVSGKITSLKLPVTSKNLRIDSGVRAQDEVSVYYDPMLMKLISWGKDRATSIEQLLGALSQLELSGIKTNRDFLCRLVAHPPFAAGGLGTDYLDQHLDKILQPVLVADRNIAICAAVLFISNSSQSNRSKSSPWQTETSFRINGPAIETLQLELHQQIISASIEVIKEQRLIKIDGDQIRCQFNITDKGIKIIVNQEEFSFSVNHTGATISVISQQDTHEFHIPSEETFYIEEEGSVQAPMTGRIVSILVSEGATVTKGDQLAVIEAMKMEHVIKAPADGIINKVHFIESDLVDEGISLFDFEAEIND